MLFLLSAQSKTAGLTCEAGRELNLMLAFLEFGFGFAFETYLRVRVWVCIAVG